MKVVNLCGSGHCPVVKIADEHVEIGERYNVCVLKRTLVTSLSDRETFHLIL